MEPFVFTGKAQAVGRFIGEREIVTETGVWTDGIGLFSDSEDFCAYRLKEGKTYKVTVEEIKE